MDPTNVGALGWYQYGNDTSALVSKVVSFATQAIKGTYDPTNRRQAFKVNGSTVSPTASAGGHGGYYHPTAVTTLGNNIWSTEGSQIGSIPAGSTQTQGFELAIPIHSASHYQPFETPFLHELVGGDRNMEQTNLVVTPDGKTCDEVTRDVSYIGNACVSTGFTGDGWVSSDANHIWTEWRGNQAAGFDYYNKDFAIAYDRMICLEDGQYRILWNVSRRASSGDWKLLINGVLVMRTMNGADYESSSINTIVNLKRGDYIQGYDEVHLSAEMDQYRIERA